MRKLAALAGMISLVAAGAAAASAGGRRPVCGPRSAHTLAASRVARVYALNRRVYGCSVHGHRSFPLTNGTPFERVGPAAVAGDVAAYGLSRSGVDTSSAEVIVRRLGDGKTLRAEPATTRPLGVEFFQSVDGVVVKADGAVAWIGDAGSVISDRGSDVEVNKADGRGSSMLDSGASIGLKSLRRHGSTISWRHGVVRRSASLS